MRAVVPMPPASPSVDTQRCLAPPDPADHGTGLSVRGVRWLRAGVGLSAIALALALVALLGVGSASADTAVPDAPKTVTVGETFTLGITVSFGQRGSSQSDQFLGSASATIVAAAVSASPSVTVSASPSVAPSVSASPSVGVSASPSEEVSASPSVAPPPPTTPPSLTIDGVGGRGPVDLAAGDTFSYTVTNGPGFRASLNSFTDGRCAVGAAGVESSDDERDGVIDGTYTASSTLAAGIGSFQAVGTGSVTTLSNCIRVGTADPPTLTIEGVGGTGPVTLPVGGYPIATVTSAGDVAASLVGFSDPGCQGDTSAVATLEDPDNDGSASSSFLYEGEQRSFRASTAEGVSNCLDAVPLFPSPSPSASAETGTVEVVFGLEVPDDTVVTLGETSQTVGGATTQGLVAALAAPAGTVVTFADVAPGDEPLTVEVDGVVRYTATVTVVAGQTTEVTVDQLDPVGASARPSRVARPSVAASASPSADATAAPVGSVAASTGGGATALPDTGAGAGGTGTTGWSLAALLALAAVALGGWTLRRQQVR